MPLLGGDSAIDGKHPTRHPGRLIRRQIQGEIGDVLGRAQSSQGMHVGKTLLPHFLTRYPGHELAGMEIAQAAKLVRARAEGGDPMCTDIFRVQAHALGLFFDEMINTFDPDALIVGGGALETGAAFQRWFLDEIRLAMPPQRAEQADIPIHVMPNGDAAGARGAALEALNMVRQGTVL